MSGISLQGGLSVAKPPKHYWLNWLPLSFCCPYAASSIAVGPPKILWWHPWKHPNRTNGEGSQHFRGTSGLMMAKISLVSVMSGIQEETRRRFIISSHPCFSHHKHTPDSNPWLSQWWWITANLSVCSIRKQVTINVVSNMEQNRILSALSHALWV